MQKILQTILHRKHDTDENFFPAILIFSIVVIFLKYYFFMQMHNKNFVKMFKRYLS